MVGITKNGAIINICFLLIRRVKVDEERNNMKHRIDVQIENMRIDFKRRRIR